MGQLIFHLLKLLAWVGENFPDSPRIGWWCLGSGTILVAVSFVPGQVVAQDEVVRDLQHLFSFVGSICVLLGLFVFFRRAVWRLQDRREKRTISLFGK